MREVPLREIADVTKISLRYLEALEQDRFDVLPAPVFAKGFLREYSRYVGLDTDEVVNSFLTATGEASETPALEEAAAGEGEVASAGGHKGLWLGLAALVGIAVLAGLAYYFLGSSNPEAPRQSTLAVPVAPVIAETPAPAAPDDDAVAGAEAPPLGVVLDFTGDCWVEAVVDDVRRISELHVQGESMRIDAERQVILTLGNPGAVRIEVNGRAYPVEGPPGQIVRDLQIDLGVAAKLADETP
jgi:cytoskeletal protein RodZ